MKIDLRSDTVTRPTTQMLEAMFAAQVGDDVFGEDPTVKALEEKLCKMFGMEAGLFCASGTMTNQIAIRAATEPQSEIICHKLSHIYLYEGGGVASNSGCSLRLIDGEKGLIKARDIEKNINADDIHFPMTRMVSLENTSNRGGGSCYEMQEMIEIGETCRKHGLWLHLDGARIFNALVATGQNVSDYGQIFDSISICLSKGLGTPVGSVLLGSSAFIKKAKRIRKVMGGGWRQAGYLAAAGIYALDHHVERMADDHRRAKDLAGLLKNCPCVKEVFDVQTNIVIFILQEGMDRAAFIKNMAEKGIGCGSFGENGVRMVTHLGIDDEMIAGAGRVVAGVLI